MHCKRLGSPPNLISLINFKMICAKIILHNLYIHTYLQIFVYEVKGSRL